MKRLLTCLIVAILLMGAVACASAPEPTGTVTTSESLGSGQKISVPAPMAPDESIFGFSDARSESSSLVLHEEPAPVIEVPAAQPMEEGYNELLTTDRMIVRTGDISLIVTDVASTIEQIAKLAGNYDGYVVSSNSWREGDRLVGNISIRVDAGYFDDAIRTLRQMAVEVSSESTDSVDVTEEYIDLSAKLHNLEASEEQLLELLKRAGEVEEILEVQRELTKTRGEIEQTKGRMQYLEQTSAMSLIRVRLEQAELDVNFSASNRTVKAGQSIRFEPRIGGGISPYSYEWDFGDGNTSTDLSPIHTYASEGIYTVTLKVTDDRGNSASEERSGYVTILPGWNAGSIASGAWNGLVVFGHGLADVIIWLGIFSPVWIAIGVILYFAWWRRRKKAKE